MYNWQSYQTDIASPLTNNLHNHAQLGFTRTIRHQNTLQPWLRLNSRCVMTATGLGLEDMILTPDPHPADAQLQGAEAHSSWCNRRVAWLLEQRILSRTFLPKLTALPVTVGISPSNYQEFCNFLGNLQVLNFLRGPCWQLPNCNPTLEHHGACSECQLPADS